MNDHCLARNSLFARFLTELRIHSEHCALQFYSTEIHHGLHVCECLRALAGSLLQ